MKKALLIFVLLFTVTTYSQQSGFWQNVRFGGGFGLSFGNTTTIAISPSAIYDFDNGFALGAGLNYTHSSTGANKANLYGISALALYNVPLVNLQISSEFEQLFVSRRINNISDNYNYPALHLGLAYRRGRASIGFRYDILYSDTKSVYSSAISPIFRFYF